MNQHQDAIDRMFNHSAGLLGEAAITELALKRSVCSFFSLTISMISMILNYETFMHC